MGRNRWIIYNPKHGVDYDASMVPAEWYGWLHYKTDKTPLEKAPVQYHWMAEHTPNTSGSSAGLAESFALIKIIHISFQEWGH